MDILKLYTEIENQEDSIAKLRQNIATELNLIFHNLKMENTISYGYSKYKLRIKKIMMDKYIHHFLAGHEILDIWETANEYEYAQNWVIPTFVLTDKDYAKKYFKLEQDWKENRKRQAIEQKEQIKQNKEIHDQKEFKRLSRKYKNHV